MSLISGACGWFDPSEHPCARYLICISWGEVRDVLSCFGYFQTVFYHRGIFILGDFWELFFGNEETHYLSVSSSTVGSSLEPSFDLVSAAFDRLLMYPFSWIQHSDGYALQLCDELVGRALHYLPDLGYVFYLSLVLPLSVLLAFFLQEFVEVIHILRCHFGNRRLRFWPSHHVLQDVGWLAFGCWNFIAFFLEMADPEIAESDYAGGVHILLAMCRALFCCWFFVLTARFLRNREELAPVFPSQCRKVQSRRCPCYRRRYSVRWVYVWLLVVVVSAEVTTAPAPLFATDPQEKASYAFKMKNSLSLSCGDSLPPGVHSPIEDFRDYGIQEQFCAETDRQAASPCMHTICHCRQFTMVSAPTGYQTCCRAVHFCSLHFEAQPLPVSRSSESDYNQLMQLAYSTSVPCGSTQRVSQYTAEPFCPFQDEDACVQSWLATSVCSQRTQRARIVRGNFGNLHEVLTALWPDVCNLADCGYTVLRPQSWVLSAEPSCLQVLVYPRMISHRVPVLILIHDSGPHVGEIYHRWACLLRFGPPFSQLKKLGLVRTDQHIDEYPQNFNDLTPRPGSVLRICSHNCALLLGQRPVSDDLERRKDGLMFDDDPEEKTSLMQVEQPIEDAMARYIRQITGGLQNQRATVWLHLDEQLGSLGRSSRDLVLTAAIACGPQIRAIWGDVAGPEPCFLFPVRPAPFVADGRQPHFIMTMTRDEHFFPMLLDYWSDSERFRATFIFVFAGFPQVADFFQQAVPENACGWLHECSLAVYDPGGMVVYQWRDRVPVYEGMFITLREDEIPSESELTTCDGSSSGRSEVEESSDDAGSNSTDRLFDSSPDESSLLLSRSVVYKPPEAAYEDWTGGQLYSPTEGDNTATPKGCLKLPAISPPPMGL